MSQVLSLTEALKTLNTWCALNTHSLNPKGIASFVDMLVEYSQDLNANAEIIPVSPQKQLALDGSFQQQALGPILSLKKRSQAKKQVLLCIHTDTVFPIDSPFQSTTLAADQNTLTGPGVADAKGGIWVLLNGLRAFEALPQAHDIGWHVFLVSDEEIGSIGSAELTSQAAKEADLGLVFEPCLPDGNLVSSRPGSWVLDILAKGKAAHAGRDLDKGINAINGLTKLLFQLEQEKTNLPGRLNVGLIQGGTAVNQVPDTAVCQLNFRADTANNMQKGQAAIMALIKQHDQKQAVNFSTHTQCLRPPKEFDAKTQKAYATYKAIAKSRSINLDWQPSFGVSDANFMAAAGLKTLDTLGPKGGNLHSHSEYVLLNSLVSKAQCLCDLLLKFSQGDL